MGSSETPKYADTDTLDSDRLSNNSLLSKTITETNLSTNAFKTFTRICPSLGPVLTSKHCCVDLIKMLGICYMNSQCLSQSQDSPNANPLHSIWPIEGDRFADLILQSLKTIVVRYGEQVIVLQYFIHVSNTISACMNRLSSRLEASLIAGIVLVNYFINYLEIKLLMDNLNHILHSIVRPAISLYSNVNIKFPNGFLMRQAIAYKILDIILLLSLRIGPEQTRIEMETTLKAYFSGFSLVRSKLMDLISPMNMSRSTKPVKIEKKKGSSVKSTGIISKQAFSRVGSSHYNARNSVFARTQQQQRQLIQSFTSNSDLNDSTEINSENPMNSYDDFLKYSYDPSTNEIVGPTNKTLNIPYKFRSQSIGLLSLNDEDDAAATHTSEGLENSTEKLSASITEESELPSNALSPSKVDDEIFNTFTNELAYTAYISISRLNSGVYIDSILTNADLIHQMCLQDEKKRQRAAREQARNNKNLGGSPNTNNMLSVTGINISNGNSSHKMISTPESYKSSSSYGASFSENVSIIGNQIQIHQPAGRQIPKQNEDIFNSPKTGLNDSMNNRFTLQFSEQDLKENKQKVDTSCHLSENWLAYWESEIQSTTQSTLDFKHINLLTLSGHSSAVKCLMSLDNESSIISGSKDRTVKLWTIHKQNKVNKKICQWTYTQHRKTVSSLLFIENLRMCASSDGSVHVWDPFVGKKLFQLDSHMVTCLANIAAPSSSFAAATSENIIKFADLRSKSYVYEFRTCSAQGSIKTLATIQNNLLLVGFSTGLICVIDMRNGWIVDTWKNHDNEILQMKILSDDQYVTTYNDGTIAIGSIKDKGQLKNVIKDWNEPVPFLTINHNQLITGTSSNKIGIHSNVNKSGQISFSASKLQPDNFKGILTCQNYLPLNRLLLLGSDNGDIKLFC